MPSRNFPVITGRKTMADWVGPSPQTPYLLPADASTMIGFAGVFSGSTWMLAMNGWLPNHRWRLNKAIGYSCELKWSESSCPNFAGTILGVTLKFRGSRVISRKGRRWDEIIIKSFLKDFWEGTYRHTTVSSHAWYAPSTDRWSLNLVWVTSSRYLPVSLPDEVEWLYQYVL